MVTVPVVAVVPFVGVVTGAGVAPGGRVVARPTLSGGHVRYPSQRSTNNDPGSASSPHRSVMSNRTVYRASDGSVPSGRGNPPATRVTVPVTPRR